MPSGTVAPREMDLSRMEADNLASLLGPSLLFSSSNLVFEASEPRRGCKSSLRSSERAKMNFNLGLVWGAKVALSRARSPTKNIFFQIEKKIILTVDLGLEVEFETLCLRGEIFPGLKAGF